MKYIKEYNGYFDPEHAVVQIGKEYSHSKVLSMIGEEAGEWSDKYDQVGNGEAEEHVIATLISWWERKYGNVLDDADYSKLESTLISHYRI